MYLEEASTFLPSCVRLDSLYASFSRSFREVEITLINPETTQERVFTVRPQNLLARTLPQQRRFILQQRNGNDLRDRRRHALSLLFRTVYEKREILWYLIHYRVKIRLHLEQIFLECYF